MFSTLDNRSDYLLLLFRSEMRLDFMKPPIFAIRDFSGGRQAAKRPMETSAVVQNAGGVLVLAALFRGSRKTVLS